MDFKPIFTIALLFIIIIVFIFFNQKIKPLRSELTSKDNFKKEIQGILCTNMNRQKIPGMQLSIKKDDNYYRFSLGHIDKKRSQKISQNHIMRIGSVSKIYTAILILKDCENGLLKLEDPLAKWVPEIPYANLITIKNLLNHTSGVFDYTANFSLQMQIILKIHKQWTPQELVSYILKGKPNFKPGEKYHYSNSNYLLLGIILEKLHHKRFLELFNENYRSHLGLVNTYFLPNKNSIPTNLISGYDFDMIPGGRVLPPTDIAWPSLAFTSGAVATSADDLLKFTEQLFSEQIISKATINKMEDFLACSDLHIRTQDGYGLGLRRLNIDGDILMGHTGTILGFGAATFFCPKKGYFISFIANKSKIDQIELLKNIVETIRRDRPIRSGI